MANPKVPAIFEASFVHGGVRSRADILARARRGKWDLVEVKSALDVKEVNVDDLAVQHWVLKGAGLDVRMAGILTLNRDYVYDGGEYDVDALFVFHDLTDVVPGMANDVAKNVKAMHEMLAAKKPPKVEPGEQCSDPYECPYYGHCTRNITFPEHPFDELPKLHPSKRAALQALGVVTIDEIPDGFKLTALQERVRDCVRTDRQYVSDHLARELTKLEYPIHHLDFETCMMALPRYKGTRPYQPLPFQWSSDIESAAGKVRHEEYLCCEDHDPRAEFTRTLLASLGTQGTICIYTSYEIRVIRELAEALPKYAKRLRALEPRCWDLCALIRERFYDPRFHGSYSLKKVLPVLVPSMSYDGLSVQDGQEAGRAYVEALTTSDAKRRAEIRAALVEYCGQDTLAMVRLREALLGRAVRVTGPRKARRV
jgi:hypothetical protein